MRHASLFSGIGGPEVAAAMLGWENVFHCEINPFGRAVLEYWFPNSVSYEDITKTSFKEWRGRVDVLTGGFPCQPFSYAGKRGGRDDDRYLWPEMLRAIDEVRPTWVIGENVAGITTMVEGGVCADLGSDSSLFSEGDDLHRYELDRTFTIERICRDLEHLGYSVQPMLVPAAAVGAPHRRDRVFIIAFDVNADLGAVDGHAGRDAEAEGEERVSKRDEVCEPGDTTEVRSPLQRLVEDTFGVRWDSGERKEEPRSGGQRKPCSGDIERICGEEGTTSTDTQRRGSDEGRCDLHPRFADGDIAVGDGGEWYATDPDLQRCDESVSTNQSAEEERFDSEANLDGRDTEFDATYAEGFRHEGWNGNAEEGRQTEDGSAGQPCCPSDGEGKSERFLAHAFGIRRGCPWEYDDGEPSESQQGERGKLQPCGTNRAYDRWREFPTVSPVHRGNDGLPFSLDNLTISATRWRTESLKAYGNAIVPQVMYRLFQAIQTISNQ